MSGLWAAVRGAGGLDRDGELLERGRRQAADPGGIDLANALGLPGSLLALASRMLGHRSSFRAHRDG
jgi:hypothetical protein